MYACRPQLLWLCTYVEIPFQNALNLRENLIIMHCCAWFIENNLSRETFKPCLFFIWKTFWILISILIWQRSSYPCQCNQFACIICILKYTWKSIVRRGNRAQNLEKKYLDRISIALEWMSLIKKKIELHVDMRFALQMFISLPC